MGSLVIDAELCRLRPWPESDVEPLVAIANDYEIARFLELRASDDAFWREWRDLHAPELRRLEAIAFRLAADPDRPWTKDDLMRLEPSDILPSGLDLG